MSSNIDNTNAKNKKDVDNTNIVNTEKEGWIYCLTNKSIPGQVKVGQTGGCPYERAKQISGTGLPTPFDVVFAIKVKNYERRERILHKILTDYAHRTNPRREFFVCEPSLVKPLFELMDGEWIDNTTNDNINNKDNTDINTGIIKGKGKGNIKIGR